MQLTKKQIGTHLINWVGTVLILLFSFFPIFNGENMWSMSGDNSTFLLIIVVPLILTGLSLFLKGRDLGLHLAWVIFTSMVVTYLLFMHQIVDAFGSLGSMFGRQNNAVSFTFYLMYIVLLALLVYNAMAILGKADKLQAVLGEKTGPTLNNLGSKAKEMTENIKEKTVEKKTETEPEVVVEDEVLVVEEPEQPEA